MVLQARFTDGYLTMYSEQSGVNIKASQNKTFNWVVPEREYVSHIELSQGNDGTIYSLRFYTNKGQPSPAFGSVSGGVSKVEYLPEGSRLVGFKHCWNQNYLSSISFITAKAFLPEYEIKKFLVDGYS